MLALLSLLICTHHICLTQEAHHDQEFLFTSPALFFKDKPSTQSEPEMLTPLQGPVVSFTSCPLGPCNPPPLVCDSANASLLDLDWSACLPSCDLPRPCRVRL